MVDDRALSVVLFLLIILVAGLGYFLLAIAIPDSDYRERVCRANGFDGSARYPNQDVVNGVSYVKCEKTVIETVEPSLPHVKVEKWVKT